MNKIVKQKLKDLGDENKFMRSILDTLMRGEYGNAAANYVKDMMGDIIGEEVAAQERGAK